MRSFPMTNEVAKEILSWEYDAPYDFYNSEVSNENIKELMDNTYRFVLDQDDRLIGFFCIGTAAQVPAGIQFGAYERDYTDIGLGLRPDLTGKGLGYSFLQAILDYTASTTHKPHRLTVAVFNERAIRLYEKVGFVRDQVFQTNTTEFLTMVKE